MTSFLVFFLISWAQAYLENASMTTECIWIPYFVYFSLDCWRHRVCRNRVSSMSQTFRIFFWAITTWTNESHSSNQSNTLPNTVRTIDSTCYMHTFPRKISWRSSSDECEYEEKTNVVYGIFVHIFYHMGRNPFVRYSVNVFIFIHEYLNEYTYPRHKSIVSVTI